MGEARRRQHLVAWPVRQQRHSHAAKQLPGGVAVAGECAALRLTWGGGLEAWGAEDGGVAAWGAEGGGVVVLERAAWVAAGALERAAWVAAGALERAAWAVSALAAGAAMAASSALAGVATRMGQAHCLRVVEVAEAEEAGMGRVEVGVSQIAAGEGAGKVAAEVVREGRGWAAVARAGVARAAAAGWAAAGWGAPERVVGGGGAWVEDAAWGRAVPGATEAMGVRVGAHSGRGIQMSCHIVGRRIAAWRQSPPSGSCPRRSRKGRRAGSRGWCMSG